MIKNSAKELQNPGNSTPKFRKDLIFQGENPCEI